MVLLLLKSHRLSLRKGQRQGTVAGSQLPLPFRSLVLTKIASPQVRSNATLRYTTC